jgi:hypothetical protein
MITTGKVIKKFTTGYSKAEQTRTSKWVAKRQQQIEQAIAKHCTLDANGQITICN